MTIVVTGAGSGGHITPILAVAHELKQINPDLRIVYIGQTGDKFVDIPKSSPDIDETFSVSAGKLRRYHKARAKEVLDIQTHWKNFKDLFRIVRGSIQSYKLLGKIKPDVVFVKGGYIGVPVGLSAAARHIPLVTHDSDAMPGLANRIISRWVKIHTTGMPFEYYNYSTEKSITVGVPISSEYKKVDDKSKDNFKNELNLSNFEQVLLITGGGLGAQRINEAVAEIMPDLLKKKPRLAVIHLAGRGNDKKAQDQYNRDLTEEEKSRVRVIDFVSDLYKYSGAADLIITRAGATNLAEFATQAKACLVIPNPYLVGGHQIVNANVLSKKGAIKIVNEAELDKNPQVLLATTLELLASNEQRIKLAKELSKLAQPESARKLAEVIISASDRD